MFKIVREGEVSDSLRGRSALYISCVYIPTDGSGIIYPLLTIVNLLKDDVLTFKQTGKVVCLETLMQG